MNKKQAYQIAEAQGCGFVANVILFQHGASAKKLKGLANLSMAGCEFRNGAYSIDTLLVDGRLMNWNGLEKFSIASSRKDVARVAEINKAIEEAHQQIDAASSEEMKKNLLADIEAFEDEKFEILGVK